MRRAPHPVSRTPHPPTTIATPTERHPGSGALAVAAALAILSSSIARSPVAALLACGVAVLAWRFGARAGAAGAVVSLLATVLLGGHAARASVSMPVAAAVLVGSSLLAGLALRRARSRAAQDAQLDSRAEGPAPRTMWISREASLPGPETAVRREVEHTLVRHVLRDVRQACGADDAMLWWRRESGDLAPAASAGSEDPGTIPALATTPPADSLLRWAVDQGLSTSNQDADTPYLLVEPVRHGSTIHGVLAVYAADRRTIAPVEARRVLPGYAARLAALYELLRDGRETRRYRGKAESLARAAERVQSSQDIAGLGQAVCEAAVELTGASRAVFVLWNDDQTGEVAGTSAAHPVPLKFAVDPDSYVGQACRERQRFTVSDRDRRSTTCLLGAQEPSRRIRSLAVVPIERERRVLGAIAVEGQEPNQITRVETSLLLFVSSVAGAALHTVWQIEAAMALSEIDALTGLPNRRGFDARLRDQLAECNRYGEPLSLILVDVDHFKQVNDRYGHPAGDAVLRAVAGALRHTLRHPDMCARYGGEELAVLLPHTPLEMARTVAERLRERVARLTIPSGPNHLHVTASFGVAAFPECTPVPDALFAAADRALYEAKASGRNQVKTAPISPAAPSISGAHRRISWSGGAIDRAASDR